LDAGDEEFRVARRRFRVCTPAASPLNFVLTIATDVPKIAARIGGRRP
jgi:hypothetical protein